MALENYQTELTLGHLYEVKGKVAFSGSEQLSPSIYINSGTLDVYSSNSATQPTAKTEMALNLGDTGISGLNRFQVIPKYIYIEQNAGTSTEIIVSGISVTDRGAI